MSAALPRNMLHIPGRLVVDPTDLTLPAPHGGTFLGLHTDVEFEPVQITTLIRAVEYGGEAVEGVEGREEVIMGFVARGYDDALISRLFRSAATSTGAVSQRPLISYGGAVRASLLTDRAVKILYSPFAPDHHPGVYFRRAVPMRRETLAVQLANDDEAVYAGMFRALRDAGGLVYQHGFLADMTV